MKKILSIIMAFLFIGIGSTFAKFDVQNIEIIDSKSAIIHFSDTLVDEPVDMEIIDKLGKDLSIKSVDVNPDKKSITITFDGNLEKSSDYNFIVMNAKSMSGDTITQSEQDAIKIKTDSTLIMSGSDSNGSGSDDVNVDDLFNKLANDIKEDPNTKVSNTKTIEGTGNAGITDDSQKPTPQSSAENKPQTPAQDKLAGKEEKKTLAKEKEYTGPIKGIPKTGPTENYIIITFILSIMIYFFMKRRQQGKN